MTDELDDLVSIGEARRRSSRKFFLGCLFLPFLVVSGYHWWIDFLIEQRVAALKEDVAEGKAASRPRPLLFREALPGNAAHDYQAIEWMLWSRDSWKSERPSHLPKTDYGENYFKNPILDPEKHSSILYDYAMNEKSILYTETELKKAKAFYERYGASLIRHIRGGLKKDLCDWSPGDAVGSFLGDQWFSIYRYVTDLMIYEATLSRDPAQELETILEVLAFAADIEEDFWGAGFVGYEIRLRTYSALKRTLQKPLSQLDLERLIHVLDEIGRFNERKVMQGRLRWIDCSFAAYIGYPLDPRSVEAPGVIATLEIPAYFEIKGVLFGEWTYFDDYVFHFLEMLDLPLSQRHKRARELYERVHSSWAVFTKAMLHHPLDLNYGVVERIQFDLIRSGAAARQFQLKKGRWPKGMNEVSGSFKRGLPKDPFTDEDQDYVISLEGADLVISTTASPYSDLKAGSIKLLQKTN